MPITEPAKIITPWADTGSKNSIPQNANNATGGAGYDKGFPDITMTPPEAGGIPPAGQDFNGVLYEVTDILRYMQAGGRPTFSAALAANIGGYLKGSVIAGDDPLISYKNMISDNSSNPNLGGGGWYRDSEKQTFNTVSEMLSDPAIFHPGVIVFWLGYYAISDGGGNWGVVRSGPHVADGGSIFSISPTLYIEANLKGKSVNVRKFGAHAVANGPLYDCITQIRACEAYVRKDPAPNLQQTMYFPCGKYGISDTWHVDDTMDFTVYFDNVYFVSMATTPKDAMILCTDWVQSQMLGAVRFDNTRNPLYANFYCGLSVQPLTKGSTKNAFYNVKSLWFPCGLKVGEDTNDLACSEQTFFNYSQFECLRAFEGAGLQSGATFVGCNLLATPSPELTGPIHAMWLKGGFWTVVGGEVLTTQSASYQCIRINPCKGGTPTYPQLRINGAIIETASPLVLIDNPENLDLSSANQPGQLQIQGSGGYCGSDAVKDSTFIDAAADFEGLIQIKNNNFYANVQRNAYNINAAGAAVIDIDKSSWGLNFRDWIGGCNGGILLHDDLLVAGAYNSGGATYSAGVKQSIKFGILYNLGRYQRYNQYYDLSTGVFTCPPGGLKSLKIDLSILSAGLNGDLFVEVDGVAVAFGAVSGFVGSISVVIENLTAGQQVVPYLQLANGTATLNNGRFNNINFTVSN